MSSPARAQMRQLLIGPESFSTLMDEERKARVGKSSRPEGGGKEENVHTQALEQPENRPALRFKQSGVGKSSQHAFRFCEFGFSCCRPQILTCREVCKRLGLTVGRADDYQASSPC